MIHWQRLIFRQTLTYLSFTVIVLLCVVTGSNAQGCQEELRGAWHGIFPARQLLEVQLAIYEETGAFNTEIRYGEITEAIPIWLDGARLRFQSSIIPIAFDGRLSADRNSISGFIQHASTVTHIKLPLITGSESRKWEIEWTPLGVSKETARLDLYIDGDGEGGMGGYFFFRDQQLPLLWGYSIDCRGDVISLRERNLGLKFEGKFDRIQDVLTMTVKGIAGEAPMTFGRIPPELVPSLPDAPVLPARGNIAYVEQAPEQLNDGWVTVKPSSMNIDSHKIQEMISAVDEGALALTHSVLVARQGKLVVEEYFYGFDRETLHDMRSASKTLASTLIGLAIQENQIEDVQAKALSFFPNYRNYANWDLRKAQITVRDLLTMSSGLDANDYDSRSVASESAYQSQTAQPDWVKFALDAPMINDPGAQSLYGSANPLILGGILSQVIDEPVEQFAHRGLFEALGITKYKFFLDPTGVLYMGGGLHMRPRDMLKYGQLYLNGGIWQDRRILSEDWVRKSLSQYGRLAPLEINGHQYGYLWWHHKYNVGNRTIETVEARGFGGQYIFVVPSLDMVVVITSGNFRTGKTRQPEDIMRQYIIPAMLQLPEGK